MREMKFRAWDKRDGKFVVCNLHIDGTGLYWWQFGYRCEIMEKEHREELIVEQYTGLKDKNGKEIYEGDVVHFATGYERADDERDEITEVKWQDKEAGFYPFTMNNRWRCDVYGVEVLGNIHENPELLEE